MWHIRLDWVKDRALHDSFLGMALLSHCQTQLIKTASFLLFDVHFDSLHALRAQCTESLASAPVDRANGTSQERCKIGPPHGLPERHRWNVAPKIHFYSKMVLDLVKLSANPERPVMFLIPACTSCTSCVCELSTYIACGCDCLRLAKFLTTVLTKVARCSIAVHKTL